MKKVSVLIVEDEGIVAMDMQTRLKQHGYEIVDLVVSGEAAIQSARLKRPDLILMDILLKGDLDGIETANLIKKELDVPIIFVTAYADKNTLERAKVIDAFGYIIKPYHERELYTNIEIAIYKHRIERKLRESEKRLDIILRSMTDGVIALDENRKITFINPAAEKMTGWTKSESINRNIDEIFPVSWNDGERKNSHESFDFIYTVNTVFKTRDDRYITIEKTEAPLLEGPDNYVGSVIIFRDISERRQYETALLRAKNAAEAANRAKSEFIANISHELRTPLNSILGMVELAFDLAGNKEEIEYLNIIKHSGETLLNVINSILDFARIEAGEIKKRSGAFNIENLLKTSIKKYKNNASKKNIDIQLAIDPKCTRMPVGDFANLQKIVEKLIDNAVKFTQSGYIKINLWEEKSEDSEKKRFFHFTVKDTGIGIPSERRESIFQIFTQADSSYTRDYGGVGLGLALVKNTVEFLGGKIWVNSKIGEGSEFHFTFPFQLDVPDGSEGCLIVNNDSFDKVIKPDSINAAVRELNEEHDDDMMKIKTYNEAKGKIIKGTHSSEAEIFFEFINELKILAERKAFNEVSEKSMQFKNILNMQNENMKCKNQLAENLFKLILAARREDKKKVDAIIKHIETLYSVHDHKAKNQKKN
ncbi:MAG: ATP-binding protein [Spirochaetota bacterium]